MMRRKLKTAAAATFGGAAFSGVFGGFFGGTTNPAEWPAPVQLFALIAAVITALGIVADAELNEHKKIR